ncbi:hypothetical protein RhiirA4_471875 [Rhizophagus irregularis]|uniref:Uncharacterized protein n=1 Tax=Rhizophagus irregularis TaxID=588596 RepID=A0A2I1H3X2_9GLOM|nr:hypothetical protein RhiirA4_471875 [Rhizophagus irregularis]
MKQLEEGKIMDIQGNKSLVIASIGDITADLPQGNDMAGVKRHGATRGCRTCNATKDSWTANNLDLLLISRYKHLADKQFEEISAAPTITRRKEIATEHGLRLQPPILDYLRWERHLQSPQDVYHATAGKVLRLLKMTIESFTLEGKSAFLANWKTFEYPRTWHKLPNPISHIDSFMMFLKHHHFKQSELTKLQHRMGISRNDSATNLWIRCWSVVARTMVTVFKGSFTEDDYVGLRECLDNERKLLSQMFEEFECLPNLHINFHLILHAKNYATLLNTSVGTKEMIHRIFKNIVPRTNLKDVSLDLLRRYNTLFALRYLMDGGTDFRSSKSSSGFMSISQHLKRLMSDWFIAKDKKVNVMNDGNEDVNEVYSPVSYISNILLKKHIKRKDVNLSLLTNFRAELALAYEDLEKYIISNNQPSFFEYASFVYIKESSEAIRYALHIGDVVSIDTDEFGEGLATVQGIFCHRSDQNFAFIIIDWFESTSLAKLDCPIYKLQTGRSRRKIFPISVVNAVNRVHFIHNCNDGECIGGNHDFRNKTYIRNMYYFNTV